MAPTMNQDPKSISIDKFDYELPNHKIAAYPLAQRDESKLLVYKDGTISQRIFKDLANELDGNSLLIFNDTKVIQARLSFLKAFTGARIEVFVLESAHLIDFQILMQTKNQVEMVCMVGNASKWKDEVLVQSIAINNTLVTLSAQKIEACKGGFKILLSWNPLDYTFSEILEHFGSMPLPPYLDREAEEADKDRYQTVYATHDGSVAAPTAGLHFTPNVFNSLSQKGIQLDQVTLHVGAGTFKPVKSAQMQGHEMHSELILISINTLKRIKESIGKNIIAVGTTSMRTIESLYWFALRIKNGWNESHLLVNQWDPYEMESSLTISEALEVILDWMHEQNLSVLRGYTALIIAPGYSFKLVTQLITNFHQPKSTLMLLVSAFVGGRHMEIYDYALEHDFRFLSFGDSSLLHRRD